MEKMLHVLMVHSDIFTTIWYFCITFVGAAITQLLSLKIGTVGSTPFLKAWFPSKGKTWYLRMNCVIMVVTGTILSFVILEPTSVKTSLCAGLTWCGTLQSLGLVNND